MDELHTLIQRADRAASRIALPEDGFQRLTRVRVRRRRNQRITAAAVGLAIGLAAVITGTSILRSSPSPVPGDTSPPISTPPSTIAFGRAGDGGASAKAAQVYLEHPDGTITPLTGGPDSNTLDAWSPDGSQVLVARTFADGSGTDLFAVRVDGSSETRLTEDRPAEADGQWSPDGSKIAFRSGSGISVINADGTDSRLLASRTNDLPDTFTWSPDGTRIAFISVEGSASEIDVVDADGTNRIVLRRPDPPVAYTQLAWSPDGTKIAFVMGSGHSTEIALMDADGKNVVRLSPIQAARPMWSPDGSTISIEGAGGVYVIDVADQSTEHLTGSGTGTVSWSPDGSVLAIYDSGDIVVMKADGTDRIRIARTDAQETSPMWQPGG
jgi:Tol biopolymer transport system component